MLYTGRRAVGMTVLAACVLCLAAIPLGCDDDDDAVGVTGDLSGLWTGRVGATPATLEVTQSGRHVRAILRAPGVKLNLSGPLVENVMSLTVSNYTMVLTVNGNHMAGPLSDSRSGESLPVEFDKQS